MGTQPFANDAAMDIFRHARSAIDCPAARRRRHADRHRPLAERRACLRRAARHACASARADRRRAGAGQRTPDRRSRQAVRAARICRRSAGTAPKCARAPARSTQAVAPLPRDLRRRLAEAATPGSGIVVEDKGYSLALHYRNGPQHEAAPARAYRRRPRRVSRRGDGSAGGQIHVRGQAAAA